MKSRNGKFRQLSDRELIVRIQNGDDDALVTLFLRYRPLIKSLIVRYYAPGMEFSDWYQEAAAVMVKGSRRFDLNRRANFGGYYRRCLTNWFNDIVRQCNAKKRVPSKCVTSYSANQDYYDDVLKDFKAIHPEKSVVLLEIFHELIHRCSPFEKRVLLGIAVYNYSPATIARHHQCPVSKVKSAFGRCRLKFRDLLDRGLN